MTGKLLDRFGNIGVATELLQALPWPGWFYL